MPKAKNHHHKGSKARGYGLSKYKHNPARKSHYFKMRRKKNAGSLMGGGLTSIVTNAVFVIVGALGSKLGAQVVLGANNTGVIGYVGNAAIGAALWMLTEHVMKNRAAASGVIAGTVVQILLRAINDFTPFGQYVNQLGMGDYQAQSWVTPQVLVDPYNSAEIALPSGWAPTTVVAAPAGKALPAAAGMGAHYGNLYTGRSELY